MVNKEKESVQEKKGEVYIVEARKEDNEGDVECVRTSSRSSTDGFLMRALAMAILCFCPPLIDPPFVPTSVSYLSGSKQGKTRQAVVCHFSVRGGEGMTTKQRTA